MYGISINIPGERKKMSHDIKKSFSFNFTEFAYYFVAFVLIVVDYKDICEAFFVYDLTILAN